MSLIQRFFLYSLVLLPSIGLFLNRLLGTKFNRDEFQHTHLAWMAVHFNKFQYQEIWDNHGALYTIVNSLFIKFAQLGANVGTYMAERYLNLVILIIGFYLLFELFYRLSGKWYLAALGPWFFASSEFSLHAIQVRPDNLQCLFLYLGVLLIILSLQKQQNTYAFGAGLSLTMMLMTNLKSLAALAMIVISLVSLAYFKKDKQASSILKYLPIGLALGLAFFAVIFAINGALDGYILDNIVYNFAFMGGEDPRPILHKIEFYFDHHRILMPLLIGSLFFIPYVDFGLKKTDNSKSFLWLFVVLLFLTRIPVNLWSQYDLLYIPMICFIASCFVIQIIKNQVWINIKSKNSKFASLLLLFSVFLFSGWHYYLVKPKPLINYRVAIDKKLEMTRAILNKGERIENMSNTEPEIGFFETGSRYLFLNNITMPVIEKIHSREVYGQEYIDLLQEKNIKLILADRKSLDNFMHDETRNYIQDHYSFEGRYWLRTR